MTRSLLATTQNHDPSCSGCPACSYEMAYILAHPEEPPPRLVTADGRPIPQPAFHAAVQQWKERELEVPPPPNMNEMIRAASRLPPQTASALVIRAASFAGDVPPAISFDEFNSLIRAASGAPPQPVPAVRAATSSGEIPPAPDYNALIRAARGAR